MHSNMSTLIGVNIYHAKGDAARRQQNCIKSLRALEGVSLANAQFKEDLIEVEGFETLPGLNNDSRKVSGRDGAQKPIASEMFNLLAKHAQSRGCKYFAFVNSDIIVAQSAIDYVWADPRQSYVFSRMDFDGETNEELGMLLAGIDFFIIDAAWWLDNSWRFRPYIIGENCWDNVYTSIILCHSESILLNREAYIRHERHPAAWSKSPFAQYTRLLTAFDSLYFSLWVEYWDGLNKLRLRNASAAEEMQWQKQVFRWQPSTGDKITQGCRNVKARLRYRALKTLGR